MSESIEFDNESISAAEHWHGGQSSMLYALSSTGHLARGTIRPRERCACSEGCKLCNGSRYQPMTDDDWIEYLASNLEGEAEDAIESCEKQMSETDDIDDLHEDLGGLMSIVETIQIWRSSRAKR